MPPKAKEYEASFFVIDVGCTSNGSGFIQKAISCASNIVKRKIFSEANSRYGMVLVGTRRSHNDLGYDHVTTVKMPGNQGDLVTADFATVKFLEEEVVNYVGEDIDNGDWLDGVVVAMDRLVKNTEESPGCSVRRIIVLTDMGCRASEDKLEQIVGAIKAEGIDFTFILPDWIVPDDQDDASQGNKNGSSANDNDRRKPMTGIQMDGYACMEQIRMAAGEGVTDICHVSEAEKLLMYKEQRRKRPFPWKVDLEVGPDLKIPTTGYISTRRETAKTWKRTLASNNRQGGDTPAEELKPETVYVRDNEEQAVIEPTEIISAYKYGSEVIPLSEAEKSQGYEGGPKSLTVIGFVERDNIDFHLLCGNGTMVFQPTEGIDFSIVGLSALTQAMVEEGLVALVRKVYRKGTNPRLGILVPEDNNAGQRVLVYIQTPYMDDLRHFQFAPLWNDKTGPTDDQLAAMDGLIDSMMLPEKYDEKIINPNQQYLFKCLTQRALNPSKGRKLPSVDEDVKRLLEPSDDIKRRSEKCVQKLRDLFKLETVDVSAQRGGDKRTGLNVFRADHRNGATSGANASAAEPFSLDLDSSQVVTSVTSVDPVQDFRTLLAKGVPLESLSNQMEKIMFSLLRASTGDQMVNKIVGCLKAYRQASIDLQKPLAFNEFVKEIKDTLLDRQEIWKQLKEDELGPISRDVVGSSKVSREEADAFLASSGGNQEQEAANNKTLEADNEEDLLDDL